MSDWGGSNDHVEGVRNGSHLEMPSTGSPGARELVLAVQEGRLAEELKTACQNSIRMLFLS